MSTKTWNGAGADNNWGTKENWGGVSGVAPIAGDDLVFAGTTRLSNNNNLAAATSFNSITYASTAGAFSHTGNSITLGGTLTNNSTNTMTLGMAIVLGAQQTVNCASGDVIFGAAVSGASGAINKTGDRTLTFNVNSTFGAGITINAGAVANGANQATAYGSGTITLNGGTLWLDRMLPCANNIVNNNNSSTLVFDNGFGSTLSGTLTNNNTLAINTINNGNMLISGNISGAGNINYSYSGGSENLTLSGTNTFTGTFTVSSGTVKAGSTSALGNNAPWSFANVASAKLDITGYNNSIGSITGGGSTGGSITLGAATLTIGGDNTTPAAYAGVISGTGSIVKTGTGSLYLTGLSTFTGKTTLSNGILRVNTLKNLSTNSSLGAPTTIANGTIALGSGSNTVELYYLGGTNTTDRVIDLSGTTGSVTIYQYNATGTLTFTSSFTASGSGAKTLTLYNNTAYTATISGAIVNSAGGVTSVTKTGSGKWAFTGAANTYTGLTTVTLGALSLDKAAATISIPGNLTINGGIVTFTNSGQLVSTCVLNMSVSTSCFNCTNNAGVGVVNITQTLASVTITDGAFYTGPGSTITITGAFSITGGTGTIFTANSGSTMTCNSLSVSGMPNEIFGADFLANTFTLYGNNSSTQTSITVGAGGLTLSGSLVALDISASPTALGSKLIVNGPVSLVDLTSTIKQSYDTVGASYGTALVALGAAVNTLTISSVTTGPGIYTIVNVTSVTGTFNSLPDSTFFVVGGVTYQIQYTATTVTIADITGGTLVGDSAFVGDSVLIG